MPSAAAGRRESPGPSRPRAAASPRPGGGAAIRRFVMGLPLDVALACGGGVAVGAIAAITAYASYVHAGGPTGAGVGIIPASLLIVAVAYGILARRRRRASDWLGLGYTVAVVLATALLMVWEVVSGFYAEISFAAW